MSLRFPHVVATVLITITQATRAQDTTVSRLAVHGDRVHTVSGDVIEDGLVVVEDGKITRVGKRADVTLPDGTRTLRAAVVTPGLIDARSVIGLSGYLNQDQDQDQLERSEAMQPELRAIDAYNHRERLVEWVRGFGITTLHTGHAPGALIAGQTMVVKTGKRNMDAALLDPLCMVACSLGNSARGKDDKAPGNRSKAVAMLRQKLVDARQYATRQQSDDPPERDLGLEVMQQVLAGEVPLLIHAHRDHDLEAALRIGAEFGIQVVLDGAAEAFRISDQIAAAGVPVIAHAPMLRSRGDAENATMTLGAKLRDAEIPFAFQSGFESYVPKTRVVLYEAGIAAAHGLGIEAALRAITLDAAQILGVQSRVGSLETGKDGDLALYDGDPFEYTTHCVATVIEGEIVFEGNR